MSVFVLAKDGRPLMPCSPAKAKHLLKKGLAKVRRRTPFTIQMLVVTKHCTQEVILGVDAGSKTVGLSCGTADKELFAGEMIPRNDVVEKLSARDPERYGPAAEQLRQKADRALQRQREKRQHEKNLREGKRKPWAAPPPPKESGDSPSPAKTHHSAPKKPQRGPSASKHPDGSRRPTKPGPGGRRLSGKLRHDS